MLITDYLDGALLARHVENGYIRVNNHPTLPLRLFGYTEHAQFDGVWDDVTRKCRGLIVESTTGYIVAFCMPKFFNYSEHTGGKPYAQSLPDEDFRIFDKVDGSMATVFYYRGSWHVATRGSFASDQAKWATEYLYSKESPSAPLRDILDPNLTYVCEIIYPENRIVVNYGDMQDMVFLTAYDNRTGQERRDDGAAYEWGWYGSVVKEFNPAGVTVNELQLLADENIGLSNSAEPDADKAVSGAEQEGYVVQFKRSGIRVKIKLSDYLRLHKVVTNCTERSVWEAMNAGTLLSETLDVVPDEFRDWVLETEARFIKQYNAHRLAVSDEYILIGSPLVNGSRKAFAEKAVKSLYASDLFAIADGREDRGHELAMKSFYPESAKPVYQTGAQSS